MGCVRYACDVVQLGAFVLAASIIIYYDKMGPHGSSETSVPIYESTRRYVPQSHSEYVCHVEDSDCLAASVEQCTLTRTRMRRRSSCRGPKSVGANNGTDLVTPAMFVAFTWKLRTSKRSTNKVEGSTPCQLSPGSCSAHAQLVCLPPGAVLLRLMFFVGQYVTASNAPAGHVSVH